jgi:hypothetical protein
LTAHPLSLLYKLSLSSDNVPIPLIRTDVWKVVDVFVIVESEVTLTNKAKDLHFLKTQVSICSGMSCLKSYPTNAPTNANNPNTLIILRNNTYSSNSLELILFWSENRSLSCEKKL